MSLFKGQISVAVAGITAAGMIVASAFTSWATASSNIAAVDARVQVIEERENNHYLEVKDILLRLEGKLDNSLKQ